MQLRLKYPPTADNATQFALDIVASALEISGVTLDFTVESLKRVDEILEGFRRDGCTSDQVAETLFGFGCYVGEVFVRNANGRWRNAAETPMASFAGSALVIQLGKDHFCNPIGKVFKRVDNGKEDNLSYFYQVFSSTP